MTQDSGFISKELYNRVLELQHNDMPTVVNSLTEMLVGKPYSAKFYHRLWKALFYGLWNYDKMLNQHYFCQEIANIIHQLDQQKARHFLIEGLGLLDKYWNRIDHHRINKFMKLIRYLLREAQRFWRAKGLEVGELEQILKDKVFYELEECNGLRFHVLDIYSEVLEEAGINVKENLNNLDFIRQLLFQSKAKQFREYIVQKIYEKIKRSLDVEGIIRLGEEIQQKANQVQDQSLRRSLYGLIGYLRSEFDSFTAYRQRKLENIHKEQMKTKKKITKGKKKQVVQLKEKRKTAKKQIKKKGDIMSKSKFEMSAM